MGILLNDSPIHQLTERVELEHCQAILELVAKPLPEARLFLLIRIQMIPRILGQSVQVLGILHHAVVALL